MSSIRSKHNILSPIPGTDRWILLNPLYGSADILSAEEAQGYEAGRPELDDLLTERGYIVDEAEEQRRFNDSYLEFSKGRDADEVQLFFVPGYSCNFACDYCYQAPYEDQDSRFTEDLINGFFSYVDQEFPGRRKYITLFGGEPLLPGQTHRERVAYFLKQATARGLDTAIVTNGWSLAEYLPMLRNARIREVQVTLDGLAEVHNARRPLKGGGPTFDRIVDGIDQLLAADLPVNLRMVLDRSNLGELAKFAAFAIEKKWTANPRFKTQLGRNYELHHCHGKDGQLFDRLEMYRAIADEIKAHPHILQFHRPAYHVARYLADNAELPAPVFDTCPGGKTEWAFDSSGHIFSCTATVGKPGESLGTFYPGVTRNDDAIFEWQDRDVLAIEKCRSCNVRLICGGGCGSVAKNISGKLHAPDCRPVEQLVGIGAGVYGLSSEE